MDNKLCDNPSTRSILDMEGELLVLMVPEPIILPFRSPPNLTSPPDLSTRSWNIELLPVMCREHPESRYHDMLCFVFFAAKDICNRNNLILRYPHFLGSFLVRFSQVLIELGFNIVSNRRNSMIILIVSFMIFPRLCHMFFGVCYVKTLSM